MKIAHRPIVGTPKLTQDWGDHQHERETHWTSLFYDLLLVAALNALAEPYEEFEDGKLVPIKHLWLESLLKFMAVIVPWNALNEWTSMFETESLAGHIYFFVHCFGIAATTQACVGDLSQNFRELATGMVLTRVGLIILWARPMVYLPRVRVHGFWRCVGQVLTIVLVSWGATFTGEDAYERFLKVLMVAMVAEILSMFSGAILDQKHRVPMHIMGFSDRVKESTMVIFGEAIFAIVLKPIHDDASDGSHLNYYAALLGTLWLIYSMALQEFHLHPEEEHHALRRSVVFGALWINTNVLKQIFLLGLSIGIKRIHLLTFAAPKNVVDAATIDLLVWGFSLTMLTVLLIRSYSFGFGRHPAPTDPAPLYWGKVTWWGILILSCWLPQIFKHTLMTHSLFQTPLNIVILFGAMMTGIILMEGVISNMVAAISIRVLQSPSSSKNDEEAVHSEATHLLVGELD